MTYVNGDVYEGDWVENAREGHGTYWKHEYGRHRAEYVGEWRRGKREGFGVFHDELGQRFEGDWVRSKRHGRGRQTAIANAEDREYQTDGSYDGGNPPGVDLYEGDWVEGKREVSDTSGTYVIPIGHLSDNYLTHTSHQSHTYLIPIHTYRIPTSHLSDTYVAPV